ncbi:RHS repeat-associated core domain-containing protein [Pseudomonas sp. SWRI81]|uniref:RHS repeat domain-containing protein n=1 Tax=Pseudomonas sp. SWRI81 TaxID=2745505 RepID=UPI001644C0B8|nr:RHS repeat-associated core domain-containing protein [Pseudomonas sp. SWRI81]MBC3268541.1 RHS repeat-associated core domain-containing protein [Pseudomonas sp. SWRI81]
MPQAMLIHCLTPQVTAFDPRRLTIRAVDYWRQDSRPAQARINRVAHDSLGRMTAQLDPRFAQAVQANVVTVNSFSARVTGRLSVDAGWRVGLWGESGQLLEEWDGRGTWRKLEYDDQMRPVAITENGAITEQLAYGDAALSERNQCGRLIRHDDPAGTLLFNDYGLTGAVLEQERRLTAGATAGFVTRMRMSPLGNVQSQTDAQANEQRFSHSLDGELAAVDLRLGGTTQWLPMVGAIARNAAGQVETQVAGNGVVTLLEYDAENGRLRRLLSRLGQQAPVQDQRFEYDALGNVLSIEEAALPIRYFANQRIEPTRRFVYDTLSQLIKATGFEALTSTHGPLSERSDSLANYCQTYRYDEGNNLLELTHVGAQSPGHRLVADVRSNRCLPVREGVEPSEEDFQNGFDGNGNLLSLQPGQALHWNLRNQLSEVRTVVRNDRAERADDNECYSYDAAGKRVRKLRSLLSKSQTNFIETLYLPGLEIRTHSGTGENLQVIDVQTGRGSIRVLHWVTERPEQLVNNQQRFSLTDHLGSITLELDQDASIISREAYYPFGGTAWVDGDAVQVSYKTVRYSGKERDATGLYYYGFRYYLPEWQRWLNPDPAGAVDGLNFFAMVTNNPASKVDAEGLVGERWRHVRDVLLPETRPAALVHPMLGIKRRAEFVAENISDPSRTRPASRQYQGVHYMSREERAAHTVSIKDKRIYATSPSGETSLLTSSAEFIHRGKVLTGETPKKTNADNWKYSQMNYVLGWSEEAPHDKQLVIFKRQDNKVHHSSAFGGGRVLDAGLMTLYEGRIAFIENKSGHYKPHMEQKIHTLQFLQQAGMDLSDTFISDFVPMIPADPKDPHSFPTPDFEGGDVFRADDFYKKRGEGNIFKAPDFDPEDPKRFTTQTQVYWPMR